MQFHYIAYRSDQGVTEGDLEAQNLKEVLENLAGRGLRPVSVKILKQRLTIASFKFWGKGVTLEDKIFLTKYLISARYFVRKILSSSVTPFPQNLKLAIVSRCFKIFTDTGLKPRPAKFSRTSFKF